jgi:hypothetical protein
MAVTMKNAIFWNVTLYDSYKNHGCTKFSDNVENHALLVISYILLISLNT